jgi:hypothetical protein
VALRAIQFGQFAMDKSMICIVLSAVPMIAGCGPAPQEAAIASPVRDTTPSAAAPIVDTPEAAAGRRILSTAFVRTGPDGVLTVELHGGRVLVLRNVVLNRADFCGAQLRGNAAPLKYCGAYAEVTGARPGGGPGQP